MRFTLLLMMIAAIGLGPATQPSSKPTSKPAKTRYSLMHGGVRYMVPAGWTETLRTDDDHNAHYESPDKKTLIVVGVSQQQSGIPEHNEQLISQMKTSILAGLRAKYKNDGDEVLYGPRSETDDRFMLRIHDRIKHDGQVLDEVHTYRAAGLDFLLVLTQARTDQPAEAKRQHEIGEDVCLSMILGQADKKKPAK